MTTGFGADFDADFGADEQPRTADEPPDSRREDAWSFAEVLDGSRDDTDDPEPDEAPVRAEHPTVPLGPTPRWTDSPAEYPVLREFVEPERFAESAGGREPPPPGTDFGWLGGPVGPAGFTDAIVTDRAEPRLAGSDLAYLDELGALTDEASMVRPYAWTRGRTRATYDLKLETLVSTTDLGQENALLGQVEHRSVSALCRYPHSVAEVAAKLSIPLGVARVILSDMADLGLISIHRTFADDDIAAHLVLMERVLSGLRRL